MRIWIPDGEACKVEWYVSQGRAVGVTSVTDDFLPHEVGETKRTGFVDPPRDPREVGREIRSRETGYRVID